MQTHKTVAFVPLRGSSKGIVLKNIREIAGKPLAWWAVSAASRCPDIGQVFVATDDETIKSTVEGFSLPRVQVIGRSAATATDTASTESALLEFAESHRFERVVLIQVTSPMVDSVHLSEALQRCEEQGADSLLSVVRQRRFIWRHTREYFVEPVNYEPQTRPLRQNFEGFLVENGAFYITTYDGLINSRCRLNGRVCCYEMPESSYHELDEQSDWPVVEQLLLDGTSQ